MKVDVFILVDIFENFRDICLKTYVLDRSYYYIAPGMSFDCCLKFIKVELELICDYDMLLMCEESVREGITQAVQQYSKANNYSLRSFTTIKTFLTRVLFI